MKQQIQPAAGRKKHWTRPAKNAGITLPVEVFTYSKDADFRAAFEEFLSMYEWRKAQHG